MPALTWIDRSETAGGYCDFCGEDLPSFGIIAVIEDMDVEQTLGTMTLVLPGPWALCPVCRGAMGVEINDRDIDAEMVKRYYKVIMAGYALRLNRPELVSNQRPVMAEDRVQRPGIKGHLVMPGLIVDGKGSFDADMAEILAHLGVSNEPKRIAAVLLFLERTFGHGFN